MRRKSVDTPMTVAELMPGMWVDLEGDSLLDPAHDNRVYANYYQIVDSVAAVSKHAMRVTFRHSLLPGSGEGHTLPDDHTLRVRLDLSELPPLLLADQY